AAAASHGTVACLLAIRCSSSFARALRVSIAAPTRVAPRWGGRAGDMGPLVHPGSSSVYTGVAFYFRLWRLGRPARRFSATRSDLSPPGDAPGGSGFSYRRRGPAQFRRTGIPHLSALRSARPRVCARAMRGVRDTLLVYSLRSLGCLPGGP